MLAAVVTACSDSGITGPPVTPPPPPPPLDTTPPLLVRELRGLWIATVANIDWPSRSGLPADQQRAELLDILGRATSSGFNTIILHVRPAGDALYQSALEPWGAMLTGTQGSDPGYDPLAFAIQEAHARGLELHAWINPFRAGNSRDSTRMAAAHVWNAQRAIVRVYGSQLWLDPGEPASQEHSMRVIRDIVTRYGMTDELGPMVYAENEGEVFLGRSVTKTTHMSEATMQKVDTEIRRIIDEQYGVARKILEDNRDKVEVMTSALLEWETIDADQINDIMEGRPPRPPKTPQGPSDTSDTPPTGLAAGGNTAAAV